MRIYQVCAEKRACNLHAHRFIGENLFFFGNALSLGQKRFNGIGKGQNLFSQNFFISGQIGHCQALFLRYINVAQAVVATERAGRYAHQLLNTRVK